MKNFLNRPVFTRTKLWWIAVPLLALLFMCSAGRPWPLRLESSFPLAGHGSAHPAATSATFRVYSPDARTMFLQGSFRVAEPAEQPPFRVTVSQGTMAQTSFADISSGQAPGLMEASAPLRMTRGINTVVLSLGSIPESTPFSVESISVTGAIFTFGNLLFCLCLAAVTASSILGARALGIRGLDLFCSASLVGFLLVTSSATILSLFHLLTGNNWAFALILSSLVLGAVAILAPLRHPPAPLTPENTLRPLEAGVLIVLTCPVFVMQILSPFTHWDDLAYHGPRAGYWMQNASALPFVSHNDRLSVFPIGGDLLYACGAMISGKELPGKFLVGLSFVLILFALLALLKSAGIRPAVSLGIAGCFAVTPIVFDAATAIKPDLWLVLWGIVTLHWVLSARRGNPAVPFAVSSCLAAAAVGAAFGIKWTAVPLLALLPFAWSGPGWRQHLPAKLFPALTTFAVAIALGGAGPILLCNLRSFHHPFGSAAMRAWHQPDRGLHPIIVQLKRLPFVLFAPPRLPGESGPPASNPWETTLAQAIGATEPLSGESAQGWPGPFVLSGQTMRNGFSLGWFLVTAGCVASLYLFRRKADRETRWIVLPIFGLAAAITLAVATQMRWQSLASVPDRFLVPAFAFGLIATAWPLDRLLACGGKSTAISLLILAGCHALPFCSLIGVPLHLSRENHWQAPLTLPFPSTFDLIGKVLPPDRRILLLAGQGSLEYPLFRAQEGFSNRIIPWGKASYNAGAFEHALYQQPEVDTVVISSTESIDLLWDGTLDPVPFVRDMDSRADFARIPNTGKTAIYVRHLR